MYRIGFQTLLALAGIASEIVVLDRLLKYHPKPFADQHLYASNFQTIALLLAIPFTYYNHTRTRRSSTLLLTFWPLYVFASAIWLRTAVTTRMHERFLFEFVARCCVVGFGIVVYLLECLTPEIGDKKEEDQPDEFNPRESPYLTANVYSRCVIFSKSPVTSVKIEHRLMFEWMTPMMSIGYSRFITHGDMYKLSEKDMTENLGNKLQHFWDLELKKKKYVVFRC